MMRDAGRFEGRQVLSPAAVSELTTTSSDLNAAYGLLWWTNAQGRVVDSDGGETGGERRAGSPRQDRGWLDGTDDNEREG